MARKSDEPVAHMRDPAPLRGNLKIVGGSTSDDWNNDLVNQVINSLSPRSDPEQVSRQRRATLHALMGIAPNDEIEGMLAAQRIACYHASMECYGRAMLPQQPFEGRRENLSQANKLSRTYATLLEALNRHRGKGQQRVTVEHVHVHEGGQAIVGSVASPGGGAAQKSEEQPHAKQIAHAPQPPMWSAGTGASASHRRCRTAVAGCTAENRRGLRRVTGTPTNMDGTPPRRSHGGERQALYCGRLKPSSR